VSCEGKNAMANVPSLAFAACTPAFVFGSPLPLLSSEPSRLGAIRHHGRSRLNRRLTYFMYVEPVLFSAVAQLLPKNQIGLLPKL